MNPRFKKRMAARLGSSPPTTAARSPSSKESCSFEVRNEAALLLSLSDIVNREVQQTSGGLEGLWHDDEDCSSKSSSSSCIVSGSLPKFPPISLTVSHSFDDYYADEDEDGHHHHFNKKQKLLCTGTATLGFLKPRCELLYPSFPTATPTTYTNLRLRSISIDSPRLVSRNNNTHMTRIASPISLSAIHTNAATSPLVSPVTPRSPRSPRRRSSSSASQGGSGKSALKVVHSSKKATHHLVTPLASSTHQPVVAMPISCSPKKVQELQGPVPKNKGIHIKTITRKKFSWKNYPELEAFLIANREEYLHHSALNYTIQQKQYNNHLTVQLLELATTHGYVFDASEFSFVTVRDRIRCYYKSYVQSAKKRGVLMGYAARKAGLLNSSVGVVVRGADGLEKCDGTTAAGRILITTP